MFAFVFGLKFRETKQIVVTFVATTLKTLLSVAKTNGRLAGSKLYSGNVYYPFLTLLFHHIPHQKTKSAPTEVSAPKNANSKLSPNELIRRWVYPNRTPYKREPHFYQMQDV